jgi:hypothetical protein
MATARVTQRGPIMPKASRLPGLWRPGRRERDAHPGSESGVLG